MQPRAPQGPGTLTRKGQARGPHKSGRAPDWCRPAAQALCASATTRALMGLTGVRRAAGATGALARRGKGISMGLDMYLYSNSRLVNRAGMTALAKGMLDDFFDACVRNGECCRWRKANAIHGWFERHLGGHVEDFGLYEVSVEQLIELRDACAEVLADRGRAEEILPTCEGYFFGGMRYDDCYFEDLKMTRRVLDAVLGSIEPIVVGRLTRYDADGQPVREDVRSWAAVGGAGDDMFVRFAYRAWW